MFTLNSTEQHAVAAVDVYNQTIEGSTAPTVTAAVGGANTSGPKVMSYAVDCRNGTENECVNGTLQANEQGQNLNSNNVVRQKW